MDVGANEGDIVQAPLVDHKVTYCVWREREGERGVRGREGRERGEGGREERERGERRGREGEEREGGGSKLQVLHYMIAY